MGAFSNDMEAKIVNHFLRNSPVTPVTTVYLALFTADPGETGSTVNEANFTGYTRKSSDWDPLDGAGTTKNTDIITFGANADVGSQIITHAAVFDGGTVGAGNCLVYGALQAAKTLDQGDVLSFAAGAMVLTLD
jgi:hypothetical protein